MKRSLLFIAALLFFSNCRSLKISDFHQQSPVSNPVPPLALKVHTESFAAQFAGEMLEDALTNAAVAGVVWIPSPYEVYTQVGEPLRDVFTLLGNELSDNIMETSGARYGQVRFKLLYYNKTAPGWGWIFPSLLTLNIANLAGMPFTKYRADLELQMEILDARQQVIARYRAPGSGKSTVALYYGYSGPDAFRKANLLALQEAMRGIRHKMEPDLANLRENLLAAGPETK